MMKNGPIQLESNWSQNIHLSVNSEWCYERETMGYEGDNMGISAIWDMGGQRANNTPHPLLRKNYTGFKTICLQNLNLVRRGPLSVPSIPVCPTVRLCQKNRSPLQPTSYQTKYFLKADYTHYPQTPAMTMTFTNTHTKAKKQKAPVFQCCKCPRPDCCQVMSMGKFYFHFALFWPK